MKRKAISILLALVMLTVALGVFAQGQEKADLCHLDEFGAFNPITIAAPAVPAHLEHGDLYPGDQVPNMPGYVLDANCGPVAQYPLAGCFKIYEFGPYATYAQLQAILTPQSLRQIVLHQDANCATGVDTGEGYVVWAATKAAADAWWSNSEISCHETPTPFLFSCDY